MKEILLSVASLVLALGVAAFVFIPAGHSGGNSSLGYRSDGVRASCAMEANCYLPSRRDSPTATATDTAPLACNPTSAEACHASLEQQFRACAVQITNQTGY
jgi:hypothetical protein